MIVRWENMTNMWPLPQPHPWQKACNQLPTTPHKYITFLVSVNDVAAKFQDPYPILIAHEILWGSPLYVYISMVSTILVYRLRYSNDKWVITKRSQNDWTIVKSTIPDNSSILYLQVHQLLKKINIPPKYLFIYFIHFSYPGSQSRMVRD